MLPQRVSSIQSCSLSHRTFPAVQWRSYQKSLPDTACCAAAEQQPASPVAPQVQEGEGQSIPSIVPEKRSFYGGLFNRTSARPGTVEVQRRCPDCQGAGTCACKDCSGSGRLKRGGYAKRNMVDMKRIYGERATVSNMHHRFIPKCVIPIWDLLTCFNKP